MKLIEKKEQKKVPELILGAKYKVIASSCFDDIAEGEIVILASAREDSEGHVRVFSADEWDYLKPEQLQLIIGEVGLVAGNKYIVKGNSKYGKDLNGKEVTLVADVEYPFSGEYVVVNGAGYSGVLVKPEQLIFTENTEKPETTYVIEFTESELQSIVTGFGATSPSDRRTSARVNGYPESVAVLGHGIYEFLKKEVLQGEDK